MAADLMRWLGFMVGLAIAAFTTGSIINTIITPRSISSRISYSIWRGAQSFFLAIADRLPRYESKDRVLAYLAPVSLLAVLIGWLLLFFLAFALLFWPLVDGGFGAALQLSGSSMFTLGVASSSRGVPTALEFIAAATGIITVALQIGYLPTIYGAYSRRETLVTALNSRTGTPSWGPEILARHHLIQGLPTLPALFAAWEAWAADMAESHTNYPWLMFFRSPHRFHSWIVSLTAVLDSAALYHALAPSQAPAEARQCLRMGFVGLRALARVLGLTVHDDPRPDDPLQLSYEEFVAGVEILRRVGFPIERSAAEAWPEFRGWRVNYEAAAYGIAQAVVAVPAPWSGERRLMTHQERFAVLVNRPR
ncbi:MAG TPA: hypothetical protein VHB98_05185, partial [Chloroflexota bacterium]|nr:hypothetical protein [Chloroflexota bacterium]